MGFIFVLEADIRRVDAYMPFANDDISFRISSARSLGIRLGERIPSSVTLAEITASISSICGAMARIIAEENLFFTT